MGTEDPISGGRENDPSKVQVPSIRRRIMQANRRRDTGPELAVRSELHRRGWRYRVDRPLRVASARPIRPDIVFGKAKLAVFIDGCFWHGCPQHGTLPAKTNRSFWVGKIAANKARDKRNNEALRAAGWRVIRAWTHEDPASVADRVESMLRRA
jgi:DNA mismatch endonuclease (patch repair protein)